MKFKFDANQEFQRLAINSVADLFEGQGMISSHEVSVDSSLLGVYANSLNLSSEEIFSNFKIVQKRNEIKNGEPIDSLDFSVEAETGTGKTYIYLRTIFELNKKYGWKKFIILVPSVAIREGVIKSLQITKEHFAELYDNVPYRFYEYQSKNISQVRHFATSSNIEIMVMTVGAFNKDSNILYSERDQMQGEQPISYIQKTNPILILDEPQNMEGEATKEALKNFNSLFRLRYSATHRDYYNLVYQLTPYDAYQLGLVKKIEVYSVRDTDNEVGTALVSLVDTVPQRSTVKAKIEVFVKDVEGQVKKKTITVNQGDNLVDKTNNDFYDGFVVDEIVANVPDFGAVGKIRFRNNIEVLQGEGVEDNKEELMREQISQTIRLHFEKKNKFKDAGIKVLSLFFIDKVDNYVLEDGFIRKTFTEEFQILKKEFGGDKLDVNTIHKGYFATNKNGFIQQENAIEKNSEAYELIMKDKERLLSFDEPTEFIFSHSALKEGWDNPNVFNICTLRQGASTLRKRQEIGRGMRLCVNQDGERIFLKEVNLLSVVANESYAEYVAQLQGEFEEDGIYKTKMPTPHNARRRTTVKLKKGFKNEENFQELWKRISKQTRYIVSVDTEGLIEKSAEKIKALKLKKPQITVERAGINLTKEGVGSTFIGSKAESFVTSKRTVDCIRLIQEDTKLTRDTISKILLRAKNYDAFLNNPEKFCFEASKIIRDELLKQYVSQVEYELIPESYSADEFGNISSYKDSTQKVERSIYDAIVFDSEVEQNFAIDLDKDERIKLFVKLPSWFKVTTPVGNYNPDWAIVTAKRDLQGNEKEKVYFVIETKGDINNLRPSEKAKIDSAKKHFEVIQVNYREVESFNQFAQGSLSN